MYVRCGECRHATWLDPVSPGSSAELVCAGCGECYKVQGSAKLASGPHEQFRTALDFANRHHLDLPSAWSVLAELMTLAEARACRVDMGLERPSGSPRMVAARSSFTEGKRSAGADPPGRKARVGLARRHGLPVSLASRVLRGALKLPAAWLLKPSLGTPAAESAPGPPGRASVDRSAHPVRLLGIPAIVGAAVLLIAASWMLSPGEEDATDAPPLRSAPAETETRRDTSGQPVEIQGPDPESVLIAFCNQEDPSHRCRPLKLVLSSPPRAGTRWGIFEKPGEPDALQAIEIRRQGGARRWVAGDGKVRIRPIVSPELVREAAERPAHAP